MNAKELSQRLAADAEGVAAYLLPGGKRRGHEWKAGNVHGDEGESLSVCISGAKAGVWKDFAADQGGDLLDLWVAVRGGSLAEAIDDAKAYLGVVEAMPHREAKAYRTPEKPRGKLAVTGQGRALQWLKSRGLTDQTIDAFKVVEQVRGERVYAVFPYLSESGEYINGKYRNIDDKRDMRQEKEAMPCLFGWHLIDPKARTVAITEGEIDAMSLHQVGVAALSVNQGAGNHQWIENDWERLERFSDILVFFDCDEPGEKGAREIITRLGPERCRRVRFEAPIKDANELLMTGAEHADFDYLIQRSAPLDPEELCGADTFVDQAMDLINPPGGRSPHPRLALDQQFDWFEFRPAEYTLWSGINGHGKSGLISQVMLGLMAQGEGVVIFSGEMPPPRQVQRMLLQATGTPRPTRAYAEAVKVWLKEKAWIFNLVGTAKLDRLLEVFEYAARRYGAGHFVIDSLMMLDVPEDGPGAISLQKQAIQKIVAFSRRTRTHIHLVAHPRKAADESKEPGKLDVAGSGKISDGADNMFSVWKAKKDEAPPNSSDPDAVARYEEQRKKPDAKLILKKQRNGMVQEYTQNLWFNKETMQYRSSIRQQPLSLVPFSQEDRDVGLAPTL